MATKKKAEQKDRSPAEVEKEVIAAKQEARKAEGGYQDGPPYRQLHPPKQMKVGRLIGRAPKKATKKKAKK